MDAIEFITEYPNFLEELTGIVKPELRYILENLKETDPHDLIRPEAYFVNRSDARGFVLSHFMKDLKKEIQKPETFKAWKK